MNRLKYFPIAALFAAVSFTASAAEDEARLLRFPSVGTDRIAFTYAGDLYTVPIDGGEATRLTSDEGFEMFSRFSPDGRTIAFTAQYDGNTEVYTIPAEGGVPTRITYSAQLDRDDVGDRMGPNNIVMCWTPDGKNIVYRSRWYAFAGLRGMLFSVPAEGGEPVQIPTTEGGFCSYSPDGTKLALNRMFREFRTWKYYRGGQADDIWVNTVGTTELHNITNNDAQDIFPMWIGDDIYFLSDRDSIMNLFKYNVTSGQTEKMTDFTEYDCKFPSYSQDYIVFENGGYIYRFTVADGTCVKVPVYFNAEGLYARDRLYTYEDAKGIFRKTCYELAPDGSRVLIDFRGDIFSLPAAEGAVYNLTSTPGAHERNPVWSPDGSTIAYISDESGEYQIYVMPYDDPSARRSITSFTDGYPDLLSWSPDSRTLYFTDEKNQLYALDVEDGALDVAVRGRYGIIRSYEVSPDGNWIAYNTANASGISVVYLHNLKDGTDTQVTTSWYNSYSPIFSMDGKYLFFTSGRDYRPVYSRVEWNSAYSVENYVFILPLSADAADPMILKGDEYKPVVNASDGTSGKENKKKKSDREERPQMKVDLDGIVERAVALPLESGYPALLASYDGALYFRQGGQIKKMDLETLKTTDVAKCGVLAFTPDRTKALAVRDGKFYVAPTTNYKADKPVPVKDMRMVVDYHKEWEQIFNETWRLYRDNFYVRNMVGKDWNHVHDKYAALLPYVNHRQDLTYLIGEMIGELATGHCYVNTGEAPQAGRISTGLLGARIAKDETGYFRINKIFSSETWGASRRSPLGEPGLGVKEGDYIVEVNGTPASELGTIYEALIGRAGVTTSLKVNTKPSEDGARTIYVEPIADETALAYFDWVQNNIRKVDEMSGGQIGYIHIPDMGLAGLNEFTKLFYSQLDKKALIIDDRMNSGGNVSPMILERLQREVYRMTMARNGGDKPGTVPAQTHYGPKVCLIDKYSSSDGDLFPYGFRKLGIGKIIGVRSWGGIVGISGSKTYLDGQQVTTPFFTSYSTDGEWIIENRGVDPDIVVDINPFEDYLGNDAQLNKAVEVLLEELENWEPLPGVPADPVR
ncbi:MAG TPA: PDZ domain-containing protein [Candidatus Coprenecus stercoravium]|uniref:Tricorn protease homolog n=1 Tax=Candidatus Coprenecus stercoravium TaxID=2840735 RepID=A0A9D2KAJ0_9BACT|nr:PDZ domain-containing protein [Candidatus Coprenecus stercoravium]